MLEDCIRIFQKELDEKSDLIVLDNYTPKDGSYLLVEMKDGDFIPQEVVDIRYNKKTGEVEGQFNSKFDFLRHLDYDAKLLEMNKPIDPKKIIHSNNYLSFFIKKDSLVSGKVTQEVIDGYYEVLKNPMVKYEKKKKSKELYQSIEEEIGKPDLKLLEEIQNWLKENLDKLEVDLGRKDYLKLFFVFPERQKTFDLYKKEGNRYLLPNIYNNNESIVDVEGKSYGLPNDNMGMNSKKPYLENKSRKIKEPYLLDLEDDIIHSKFFDYLNGKAARGYTQVYIDLEDDRFIFCKTKEHAMNFNYGFYIKMQKGKEVELHNFDIIPKYNYNLERPFYLKEIIELTSGDRKNTQVEYGPRKDLGEMERTINDILFGKWLINNYFTPPSDLSINDGVVKYNLIKYRERLNNWFYKSDWNGIEEVLDDLSMELLKNTVINGYITKEKNQLNLRLSLIDYFANNNDMEVIMGNVRDSLRRHINSKEDWEFDNDEEYFYAVGQAVNFYLSKLKSGKKPQSYINPFLNAKKDHLIKRRINNLYQKINYALESGPQSIRDTNLTGHVLNYTPKGKVNQDMIVCGFVAQSLIYEKKEEK